MWATRLERKGGEMEKLHDRDRDRTACKYLSIEGKQGKEKDGFS